MYTLCLLDKNVVLCKNCFLSLCKWYMICLDQNVSGNMNDIRNDEQILTASTEEPREEEKYMHSRWNPTPEQTMVLEEVYSSGIRTPTIQQIHEIASKLQNYGRIEGKNVFYWFQNHKSRERLKRRRGDQQVVTIINNVHEEPLHKDNAMVSSGIISAWKSYNKKKYHKTFNWNTWGFWASIELFRPISIISLEKERWSSSYSHKDLFIFFTHTSTGIFFIYFSSIDWIEMLSYHIYKRIQHLHLCLNFII